MTMGYRTVNGPLDVSFMAQRCSHLDVPSLFGA